MFVSTPSAAELVDVIASLSNVRQQCHSPVKRAGCPRTKGRWPSGESISMGAPHERLGGRGYAGQKGMP
jgi:hypothetical protein